MSPAAPTPDSRLWRSGFTAILISMLAVGAAHAQSNPAAQALPYTQDFRALAATSTVYPAGWQGWINGAPGAAYLTTGPTADQALGASGSASSTAGGVHNFNGKIGPLDNGTNDYGLVLAVNTTGLSGVVAAYEAMTIRNPHDGAGNTRVNEISLQYRVGTAGPWTTLAGTAYQNNTTTQTGSGVVTPQKIEYRSVTLPAACDNQAAVQLRWAQREVGGAGSRPSFAIDNVVVQQPPAGGAATAIQFDGVDDYVTFGQAPGLGASTFTIETWFRRTDTGVTTSTGAGGIAAILPLVAKGFAEADGSTADMNYILGINTSGNVIAVDYEEGTGQTSPGLNHPLSGTTAIALNTWYHAAATFDGTTLRIYLNGTLEGTLVVGAGRLPQSLSIQHATLATALNSTGGIGTQVFGRFKGQLDEARIWNLARTTCDIVGAMNLEVTSGTGLLARWGMHDGAGSLLGNSLATPNGILMNGPTWVAGSPFNAPAPALTAPSGLVASAPDGVQISLAWTDNATGETAYEVERSTSGPGGPFTLVATLAANANSYLNAPLTAGVEFCYRVRATTACTASGYSDVACATTTAEVCNALQFDPDGAGTDAYVTFGNPATLQLTAVTLEMWMRRDGPGVGTNTGTGGIPDLIPLVAKGRAEAEAPAQDINYIFGIRASDGVLCADFEEGPGGGAPSQNHPVAGTTTIGTGSWHHVAATYDGTTWKLYLDGIEEASLLVGQPLGSASTVAVAMASALTSGNAPAGAFDGAIDELRIWNVARSQAQIQADINSQITTAQAGLIGRWALNEAVGTVTYGTAGTTIHGSIIGSPTTNWNRVACAPFDASLSPPTAPTGLVATAVTSSRIDLSWTDTSDDETGFEIERSTTGIAGTYTLLATVAANSTSHSNTGLTPGTESCYRVRAINAFGASTYAGPTCATTPLFTASALSFSGSTAQPTYAGAGNPAQLQLSALTLEMWLRRDGAGEGTNTGTGGIADAIPLVAKGRAESETAATDINYLFGIRASTGALCADFEEGAGGSAPSQNHPIEGVTPLALGTWYHVAATYDGTTWKLYLNGALEASNPIGQPLASASTVATSLGSALTSGNVAAGFFNGTMDEVRIWNVARDQAQIQSTANAQLSTATPGLVARWSLDEGTGTAIGASAGTTANATITGPNYAWSTPGAPFNLAFNQQPAAPLLVAPADDATGVSTSPSLDVAVSDPDGGNLTVNYYGRVAAPTPGPDFTLIGLPDTQYYTGQLNGGTPAIFNSQANWIVANRAARNIVYVGQLGDCVERGDNGGNDIEWQRADAALSLLENPGTTGLPEGIPFGVSVGNHDQSPIGDAAGTTTFYNQYFGESRFLGRQYYGGHYGANNDNWYELFSASGMDFIVISFEYDTTPDAAVLAWADNLLATNSSRRGIVLSHFISNTGTGGGFGPQGQAIYDALKSRANLDLMLCGHVPGEGRREDTFGGNTVHTMLSDYQGRTAGGNGWLRILEFSPASNEIRVKTYSPWLTQFETDGDSQFSLPYDMNAAPAFQLIGTNSAVPSGSTSSLAWSGRDPNTEYEWYATVSDGSATTTGSVASFTTAPLTTYTLTYTAGANGSISGPTPQTVSSGGDGVPVTAVPDPGYHFLAWSDAVATATRSETNVTADLSVTASFEIDAPVVTSTVNVGPAPGLITLGNPTRTVPVTISRTDATPLFGFSVSISVPSPLAVAGGPGGIHEGAYLSSANPATTFIITDNGVDLGGNHNYEIDGATLGLPCGSSAASGTLFTIDLSSASAGGSGTVSITDLILRNCANVDLPRVIGTASTIVVDQSAPVVQVIAPNGLETWPIGSSQTISWTGSDPEGIASFDLAYSTDGGATYPNAIATVPGTTTSFAWTVPATPSLTARVRVTAHDVNANSGADASDANFAIGCPTISVTDVTTHVACNGGATGAIDITASGGTPPYTYAWAGGPTTEDRTGLPAGGYSVVVTDANGCTGSRNVTVTEPPLLVAGETHVNVSCFGGSNGSIDVTASGGTPPYSYVWNDASTSEDRTGLVAGTYSVVVTDANGCTANAGATITQPPVLAAGETHVNVSCFGGSNGSINVTPSGGTPPYSYLWNDASTAEDRTGLSAGTYSVVVTDANGCTANTGATITQPPLLAAGETHVNVLCFGAATGSIDVSVSGGTPPYSYLWNDASTAEDRSGLVAGTYSVIVTDANGCTANTGATITQPPVLAAGETHVNVLCFGAATGSIDVTPSGGTPPYSYLWNDASTAEDRTGLVAGTYSVIVTDANGCTANTGATITQPTLLVAGETHTDACLTAADGTIDVTMSGGTPPYTYLWNDAVMTEDRSGLAAGSYSLTVTDANLCTTPLNVTVGLRSYTITATAGANGAIVPSGPVVVTCGADQPFAITPALGYHVLDVVVDAVSEGPLTSRTFLDVQGNHSIAATFEINPPVAPVANLVATQVRTGNPAGQVTRIALTWNAVPGGTTVEVWRAPYGHYPQYDEAGGAEPAVVPAYPPGGPWTVTGVSTSGGLDLPATRDFYYYVAYARDGFGTWSPASNRTAGTLNYHLGDVSNGFTIGTGNNSVFTEDLTLLGAHYGVSGAGLAPYSYLDVGPTSTGYIDGRPLTDLETDFEDLVMFALNFNQVSAPGSVDAAAAAADGGDEIRLDAPSRVAAGDNVVARLGLRGSGALRALATRLEWDPAVVEPFGHAAGEWLALQGGVAFAPAPGAVDAAVFGAAGMAGEGDLALVNFRAIGAGDPRIRIASADGRDARNQTVAVTLPEVVAVPAIPRVTQLAACRPNPFLARATIAFSLATPGPVQLSVFSVDGRRVRTLANDVREPGEYSVTWDGRDDHGAAASSGVYYVQLVTATGRFVRSATYLR